MSDQRDLRIRHSSHIKEPTKTSESNICSKSDLNVPLSGSSAATSRSLRNKYLDLIKNCDKSRGEYYKRYEHDEVPVKDIGRCKKNAQKCLTDVELDNLETRIFRNVSQELQTDECSISSLESNIKFFKTTVEKIFDNFYNSMRDFEHYKRRFHEILARSKEGSMDDMEEFIKDMFEHIMSSSDNSTTSNTSNDIKSQDTDHSSSSTDSKCTESLNSAAVIEAYKNENSLTDTSVDDKSCKGKVLKIDDIFNVFLLDGKPCVQIKLNDRNLLSEINIKDSKAEKKVSSIASADNMRKVTAKKIELEQEEYGNDDNEMPDRDIPVKVSYAKKNIHLDEDFAENTENTETTKSFLSKICNLLCKRFRKTTLGS